MCCRSGRLPGYREKNVGFKSKPATQQGVTGLRMVWVLTFTGGTYQPGAGESLEKVKAEDAAEDYA